MALVHNTQFISNHIKKYINFKKYPENIYIYSRLTGSRVQKKSRHYRASYILSEFLGHRAKLNVREDLLKGLSEQL